MAPHPAVIAAQKAALDKAKGTKPKTAADNRQEVADQANAALAKLGLSTPSPRNNGYDGSLNEPGARPPSTSITERIARLRRSLSDEKVKNQSTSSKFSLQKVKDRVKEGYADLSDGYGTLRADKVRNSAEQAEYDLDRANNRRMRRADRRQKRQEEEETKDQVKSVPTSGYVSMHSSHDAPSPPTKLGQAKEKLLRTGSLFASTMTKAARALEAKVKKRSPTEKVDQRACSGGGRVAASTYVQRAHLQYDTVSPEAVTGRLQAAQTLRGDGGLWALKARYVAATKAVPGQLRMARDAEEHAARLADTLAQANERFEALKTQENLLRALVEEARRLASTEKPANGLLASFPAGAPPPAALDASPASSRASRSPASVGSPAASRSRASSAASEAPAEPAVAAPAPAAAEEPPPAPQPAAVASESAAEPAVSGPASATAEESPPAPEPAATDPPGDGMPSWMAPDPAAEEAPSSTPVVEPAEAADDAAPVTPDEEDSPAFTDDEDK